MKELVLTLTMLLLSLVPLACGPGQPASDVGASPAALCSALVAAPIEGKVSYRAGEFGRLNSAQLQKLDADTVLEVFHRCSGILP